MIDYFAIAADEARKRASVRITVSMIKDIEAKLAAVDAHVSLTTRTIDDALTLAREATDGALDNCGLVQCVKLLISQRDNARHSREVLRTKLKELGYDYVG